MRRPPGRIDTIDSLRRRIPTIVRAVNADPALALRASANPLLALEELGFELTDRVRREADHRVRFAPDEAARLTALARDIDTAAGEPVDIQSAIAVRRVLAALGLEVGERPTDQPEAAARGARRSGSRRRAGTGSTASDRAGGFRPRDDREPLAPLVEPMRGRHPIVEPLLAYLALDATRPRLAPRDVYEALRERKPDASRPDPRVRFVLQRAPGGG